MSGNQPDTGRGGSLGPEAIRAIAPAQRLTFPWAHVVFLDTVGRTVGVYTSLARPLLFTLAPETAQKLAEAVLAVKPLWKATRPFLELKDERLRCDMGGIALPNPVGLAGGYDKDGRLIDRLANLGFGYIVAGTVVAEPRAGNPRPRLVRDPGTGSLTNSLGFPSQGLERVTRRLRRAGTPKVPLVASISGLSVEDFVLCHQALQPLASGLELNISSPNTEGIRVFQEPQRLEDLLVALKPFKEKPLFLKLPPYFDEAQKSRVMELVDVCLRHSVDGVTAINTRPVADQRLATGQGGLSGKPLLPHMLRIVGEIRGRVGASMTINACGGIFSGEDALQALLAGADTVQLFTGFIYGGPGLVRSINRHLLQFMVKEEMPSIRALPGRAARVSGRDLPS